jgi:hypothetical protein
MGTFHIKEPIELSYIHCPRTGMAMKQIIKEWIIPQYQSFNDRDDWMLNHPSLKMVRERIPTGKTFTVVRNPWQRIFSFYTKIKTEGYWLDWNGQVLMELKPINEWIIDYCNPEVRFDFPRWFTRFTNMVDFINDDGHWVDFICKAENLNKDFKIVTEYLNNSTPLPDISNYDHYEYKKYLNNHSIKLLAKLHERDLDFFKY